MAYWLFKSEPDVYSIDDLARDGRTPWNGVRNYQARNFQQAMKAGDIGFFYHSRCTPPAVVGLCRVAREAYPDPSALDLKSPYYDPKASITNPRWYQVDVEYIRHLNQPVSLKTIRATDSLKTMVLVTNSRLSVQPVTTEEFQTICQLSG